MINKFQYFFIFLLLNSWTAFTSEPRSLTPHPSNHSDETRSSDIASPQSTLLDSSDDRSLNTSPEPENPNPNSKKKLDLLQSIIDLMKKTYDKKKILENAISAVLDMSQEEFQEKAHHEFYGPNHKPHESRKDCVRRRLHQLGLTVPLQVTIEDEPSEMTDICKFNAYEIVVHDSFFKISVVNQDLILAEIAERLNNDECGKEQLIKTLTDAKQVSTATRLLEESKDTFKFMALLRMLKKSVEDGDVDRTDKLVYRLQQSQNIFPSRKSSPTSNSNTLQSSSPSPREKRLKIDPMCK